MAVAPAGEFDLFHIADHSYSQLVHVLPPDRTGVFCHDLDTFRCLLDPSSEPRPKWFRSMTLRILQGMQKARVVFYSTSTVREQILRHGLIDPAKLVQAPCGIAPEFNTTSATNLESLALPACVFAAGFLLHVGSCIRAKRIDILLNVFAEISRRHPDLWLLQVGGQWTDAQRSQLHRLGIASRRDSTAAAATPRRCRALSQMPDAAFAQPGRGVRPAAGRGAGVRGGGGGKRYSSAARGRRETRSCIARWQISPLGQKK